MQPSADGPPARIEVTGLTKRFGSVTAVQDLSFAAEPGSVTGFLGPNGSGKSTTIRMILGLQRPDAGTATIGGRPAQAWPNLSRVAGAVLDTRAFHPGRSALQHLQICTAAMGLPDHRAEQVLGLVGLTPAARRSPRGYSLGMRQRLSLATALLADPQVLLLDEPANGLDPQGMQWLRELLTGLAAAGRTVFISSHQLAELDQFVDSVVVLHQGQAIYHGGIAALRSQQHARVVFCPNNFDRMLRALQHAGVSPVESTPHGWLAVRGVPLPYIADVALAAGVALYGIHQEQAGLEQLYLGLTENPLAAGGAQQPYSQQPYSQQPGGPQ